MRYGANATIPNVAKTIVPSMISGHRYDDQPGHADIAARSRSDSEGQDKAHGGDPRGEPDGITTAAADKVKHSQRLVGVVRVCRIRSW